MAIAAADVVPLIHARAEGGAEREHIRLVLLEEMERGLADVGAGRARDAREALVDLKRAAGGDAPEADETS